MGADPLFEPVPDRADQQVGVQPAEHPLHVLQRLVGGHRAAGAQRICREAGADDVDPVQRGFGGDLILIAPPGQALVGDVHDEVPGDLLGVDHLAHGQGDGVFAAQRPAGPPGRGIDLRQLGPGGLQQLAALAGPLICQERVAAGDQPLPGVVRGGDLGHVGVIEQGRLDRADGHQRLDRRAAQRGDPVQLRGLQVVTDPGAGDHPPVAGQGHMRQPEPLLEFLHLVSEGGRVAGVALEDLHRDRDPLGGGEHAVDDLQPAAHPVPGVPDRAQRAGPRRGPRARLVR